MRNIAAGRTPQLANGRPRKVSVAGIGSLNAQITENSLNLQAVHEGEEFRSLVTNQMAAESKNGFGMGNAEEVSDKTLTRILNEIKARRRVAKVKTPARTAAHDDIRSPIALCAVLSNVFEKVDPSLFISSDDVSILINDNHQPHKVLTTKEASDLLAKTNTSVSVTAADKKHRVVSFNVSISAGFQAVCKVVKFADRCFKSLSKPKVLDMGDGLFFCLYPYGMTDSIVNEAIYRKCILRSAVALREKLVEGLGAGMSDAEILTQSQSQSQSQSQLGGLSAGIASTAQGDADGDESDAASHHSADSNASVDSQQEYLNSFSRRGVEAGVEAALSFAANASTPDACRKQYEWICLACDGAYGQITALTDEICDYALQHALHTIMTKYSAGRSLSESPNDLGWMHSILHQSFKSYKFRYGQFDDPPGKLWADLKAFLKSHLDSSSFKTVWRCFCFADEFLDKAFTKDAIRSAFRKAGIAPLDYVTIMSHNKHFRELSKPDAEWVISTAIPAATKICSEKGFVPEEDLKRILNERPSVDNSVARKKKQLNDMATNRQRALILNHPEFLQQLKVKKAAAAAKKAAEEADGEQGGDGMKKRKKSQQPAGGAKKVKSGEGDSSGGASGMLCSACHTAGSKGGAWKKCSWRYCRQWFCPGGVCKDAVAAHEAVCSMRKNGRC